MKTRWDTCVFILLTLLTGTLLSSEAGLPANAGGFGQTPSGLGSSFQLQVYQAAPTGSAQAAEIGRASCRERV